MTEPGTKWSMIENLALITLCLVMYARTPSLNEAGVCIGFALGAAVLLGYDLGKWRWQ